MKQIYMLAVSLLSLSAVTFYSAGAAHDKSEDRNKKTLTEERREMLRELEDHIANLDPRDAKRAREDKEFLEQITGEALDKIVAHRGKNCNGIVRYSAQRDKEGILQIFADNWYWLVADGVGFLPEDFLNAGDKELRGKNREDSKIFIYCLHGKPVVFIAYYTVGSIGKVRMLGNDKKNGSVYQYVEQLMQFALDDMKKMGARSVELATRVDNELDIDLYKQLGFVEIERYGDEYDEDGKDKYIAFTKYFIPKIKRIPAVSKTKTLEDL